MKPRQTEDSAVAEAGRKLLQRHLLSRRAVAADGQLGRFALADTVREHGQQATAALA